MCWPPVLIQILLPSSFPVCLESPSGSLGDTGSPWLVHRAYQQNGFDGSWFKAYLSTIGPASVACGIRGGEWDYEPTFELSAS